MTQQEMYDALFKTTDHLLYYHKKLMICTGRVEAEELNDSLNLACELLCKIVSMIRKERNEDLLSEVIGQRAQSY